MSKPFKQIIRNIQGSTALVESAKGNIYPVVISDKVRLQKSFLKVGDIGIINRVNGKYYLIDVEPRFERTDTYMSKIPEEELGYGY
jgi:bisphosphoglycerate-independent phosphoglycerate mutase (AlkP superfamily)